MTDATQPGHPDDPGIHTTISTNGTEIAGRVHGQGPPVVLAHGGLTDGDLAWKGMLPLLTDRYRCYVPSMRGTGLSEDHPDQRPERHMEDLAAFIDSIGESVAFVGHSTGGFYGLGAVERGAAVEAVAVYEPPVFRFWEEGDAAQRFRQAVSGMAKAAADGKLSTAARSFLGAVSNEQEMTTMAERGAFEAVGPYAPKLLQVLEQAPDTETRDPTDPSELSRIRVPVLLAFGARSTDPHIRSIKYLADHLPDHEVREIPGVGHMAPEIEPEPVAEVLLDFLERKLGQGGDESAQGASTPG
jgi:pimeloyl-ACP methyl ester carboxylesterase